jgi:RND family efflux transporter MFP subunit
MDAKNADLSALRINRADPVESGTRPNWGRWILLTVLVIVVIAVATIATRGMRGGIAVRLTPATLVAPSQANVVVIASGYVVAQRKAAVASKGTGRLVYLGVVEGDRVRAGQVLARIEDSDIRAQLAQARAQLQLARADLRDVTAVLARQKFLLDSGLTSQAEYDGAEARHQRVLANIALAEAGVTAADVQLENTVIRAPFDGTVLTKNADVGEVVAPLAGGISKAAVVTIADLGSLQVEVDVSESSIELIVVGQPAEIVLDAYPDVRYPGYVAKIVPTADRAKATVQVKVAFRRYDGRVLPDMSAKVHFLPREEANARAGADTQPQLTVPQSALALRDGRQVVFTVSSGRAVEIPVVTGRRVGRGVAVLQGLAVGTQVIDSVDDRVRGGLKVKVP